MGFDTQGQNHLDVYGDPQAQQFYWTGHNPTALAGALRYTRVFVRVGDGLAYPLFSGEATNVTGAVAEADLSRHAADFVAAAHDAGADVHYEPTTGVHDWPYWRLALRSALSWGFFRPVDEAPSDWSYQTVSRSGRAWDVSYAFAAPPVSVETFVRSGDRLRGSGSGVVTVAVDGRAPFTATLPFDRVLPPAVAGGGGSGGSGASRLVSRHRHRHPVSRHRHRVRHRHRASHRHRVSRHGARGHRVVRRIAGQRHRAAHRAGRQRLR